MRLGQGARLLGLLGAALGALAAVAVGVSCLPDLKALPPLSTAGGCGDGFLSAKAGEQCDPGDAGPGGTEGCTAACTIDCFGAAGFVDPASNHCYFLIGDGGVPNTEASNRCNSASGHLLTLGSEDEVTALIGSDWYPPGSGFYWVGLQLVPQAEGGPEYISAFSEEPGWAPAQQCAGCYAPNRPGTDYGFAKFGGPDAAGGRCVVGQKSTNVSWNAAPCPELFRVICEREPAGWRARRSGAVDWELDVKATFGAKRYLYHPGSVTRAFAESACAGLNDGGAASSLVILDTREEREQLLHELSHLPDGSKATRFWIGLSRGGNGADWTWDDGTVISSTAIPIPWGNAEPQAALPARAYVIQSEGSYDTQLAHADDTTTTTNGYVCQF